MSYPMFDERLLLTASAEDVDKDRMDKFFGGKLSIPWDELLRNTRVTAPDEDGMDRPTVAGLLAFGTQPERHLPSAFIEAAGALPDTLTVETMAYRVFTRNQLLVQFLTKMRSARSGKAYLESRGEGVRRILEASEAHSHRTPEYRLFGDELRLTIWAKPSPHAA